MSRVKKLEALCLALFNCYLKEHGGQENQPYLTMCWMSGRVDDLINFFNDKNKTVEDPSVHQK